MCIRASTTQLLFAGIVNKYLGTGRYLMEGKGVRDSVIGNVSISIVVCIFVFLFTSRAPVHVIFTRRDHCGEGRCLFILDECLGGSPLVVLPMPFSALHN